MNWPVHFMAQLGWKDAVDIFLVSLLIYQIFLIVRGTRAVQVMFGIGALVVLFWVSLSYKLYSVTWLLEHFFDSFFIFALILFQDQIRQALATVGTQRQFFFWERKEVDDLLVEELVRVCEALSREKTGALIALERNNGLMNYISTGTRIEGEVHGDLLYSIFQPKSPLHDGSVIISKGKLAAAGCFLPLSRNVDIERHMGTRHRAALGLSEISDAIVIAVSEETGHINVVVDGKFHRCERGKDLRHALKLLSVQSHLSDQDLADIMEVEG